MTSKIYTLAAALFILAFPAPAAAQASNKPVIVDAEAELKAGRDSRLPAPFVGTWNCTYEGRQNKIIWSQFDRYIERCTSATLCSREYKSTTYIGQLHDTNRKLSFAFVNWNGVEVFFRHPDGNDWKAMPTNSRNFGGSTSNMLRYQDAVKLAVTSTLRGVSTRFDCTRAP